MPCILFNQSTQVGLAVVKQLRQGGQRQILVIVLDILKHKRKIRTHLVIVKLKRLAVITEQVRKQ